MGRGLENHFYKGLTEIEIQQRRMEDGYNELPQSKKRNLLGIAFEVMHEPMFLLLIACGVIYLLLGDKEEAAMLLGFVFFIIGITLYQEQKTERALDALRDLSSPRALVIRDGEKFRIAGREVVRDDIILISEGDRVPADAVLLSATNLNVDESFLTGESFAVRKKEWEGEKLERPGGDDLPFVFSSTLVVKGQGIARVTSTGVRTEIGKIGKALQVLEPEESTLQKQTKSIVRWFASIGIAMCVVVIIVFGLTRGNWLDGFLAGIALAMATLPEEFPVVLTVFLALGAWRISRYQVLTRRIPAVETLGATTALCVDKTGTLTLNQMRVTKIADDREMLDIQANLSRIPDQFIRIVEYGLFASPIDPFDPMEKAIKELSDRAQISIDFRSDNWLLKKEYPLSKSLLSTCRVWESPISQESVIAAKGAPEAIADLCHLDEQRKKSLITKVDFMSSQGLRVIGVARGSHSLSQNNKELPVEQRGFAFEFLGLLGLTDPVRQGVAEAIQDCYSAGIRVIMITGDYPGTARNIAHQIGLKPADQVITGPDLDRMDDASLQQQIKKICIFARVVPEQKLRIVNALKANGEVVAMTGDGVNDAPALKSAHIGIAMGGRGTDVARESASLVLLDDNFASIVKAIRMGRRIFNNLKKAMAYIYSVHIPIAGMALIPVLLKWPLALLPVHIVFLELIIDPACSIVFEMEDEEADLMERPPRKLNSPLFGREIALNGLIQGLGILTVVLVVYSLTLMNGYGEFEARMMAFTSLVIANICLIFANRSDTNSILSTLRKPNPAIWWVTCGAILFLGACLTVPFLRELFRFAPLHPWEVIALSFAGLLCIFIVEFVKFGPWRRWVIRNLE
jgi:Ca2+-transporting ATPase